ncbi:MAG TPA: type I-C CRISPR-associated protein Cas5c [Acidimicrobiales bacterium]|nr:type I-C CRISPR-associated protein Cas5c [Acidimicrobiales bacterium]
MVATGTSNYPAPSGGPVSLRVWGKLACFTRPEFGAERVSYPMMTPSAAVGVLDAIYWKPQFRWRIVAIDVVSKGRTFVMRRNEIGSRQSEVTARRWQETGERYDAAEDRQQRSTMVLSDVAYVVHAHCEVFPGVGDNQAKHRDQLRRRVALGQCHERPYLGCREFAADFSELDPSERPVDWTEDFGLMLRQVYPADAAPAPSGGRADPRFFRARVEHGRLVVPYTKEP